MKDRLYIENTKSKFINVQRWLLSHGYKLNSYGDYNDAGRIIGEAYFVKPGIMLKALYIWDKTPEGNGYRAGKMLSLEDVTSCYSVIDGKKTGY